MSQDQCEYCGQEERYGHNAICVMNTVEELRAEIEQLRAFANSIGQCTCAPGMCDTKTDFQCRAREAITGVSNQQKVVVK